MLVEAETELFPVCHVNISVLRQVTKDDNIIVSTGYGRGVSKVKVGVADGRKCLKYVPEFPVTG